MEGKLVCCWRVSHTWFLFSERSYLTCSIYAGSIILLYIIAGEYALATRSRPTLLNEVNCIGTENTISDCPESSGQCLIPGAGIICQVQNGNSQQFTSLVTFHFCILCVKLDVTYRDKVTQWYIDITFSFPQCQAVLIEM